MKLGGFAHAVFLCGLVIAVRCAVYAAMGMSPNSDGAEDIAKAMTMGHFVWNDRPTQLLYPLLLTPVYFLGLPLYPFVFVLHTAMACGMVVLGWLAVSGWLGKTGGFIVGVLLALHLHLAYTARFVVHDTLFYFLLSLLVWALVRYIGSSCRKNMAVLVLVSAVTFFTRPESWVMLYAMWAFLAARKMSGFLGWAKAAAATVVPTVVVAGVLFGALIISPNVRDRVFSLYHFSAMLWMSTHTLVDRGGEEASKARAEEYKRIVKHRESLGRTEKSRAVIKTFLHEFNESTGHVNNPAINYYFSEKGFYYILEHPLKYVGKAVVRSTVLMWPGFYNHQWHPVRRLYDLAVTIFLFAGAVLALCRIPEKRIVVAGICVMAASIWMFLSFYAVDPVLKQRQSLLVLMTFVAPAGWLSLGKQKVGRETSV